MSDYDPDLGRKTATDRRLHVRMTVGFFTNDHKLRDVVDPVERMAALALLGACIGLSRLHGSDGHIRLEDACLATGLPIEYGKLLVADGAVHQADHGCPRCPQPRIGLVYVHDYLEHNRSAAQELRILEKRRQGGVTAAERRWEGHQPAVKEKRPPGRPRKHPKPEPGPSADLLELAAQLPNAQDAQPAKRRPGRPRKEPRVFEGWVVEAANLLADLIARNDPNGKRPNVTDAWLNEIRLTHEIDGRTPEMIVKAIEWSQNHRGSGDFSYADIIKSPKNLRKHFAAMHSRAIKEHRQQGGVRRLQPAPATVSVSGMAGLLAQQMDAGPSALTGGMIKGER